MEQLDDAALLGLKSLNKLEYGIEKTSWNILSFLQYYAMS